MTQTQSVSFDGRRFWAWDAALAVWLIAMMDEARRRGLDARPSWKAYIDWWEIVAIVSDYGLRLDEIQEGDLADFRCLAVTVNSTLAARATLPAEEIIQRLIKGKSTNADRYGEVDEIDAAPIARLGRAIVDLIDGSLPQPPPNDQWLFGTANSWATVRGPKGPS